MTATEVQNLQNGILGLAGAKLHDQTDAEAAVRNLSKSCGVLRARLPAGVNVEAPPRHDSDTLAHLDALARYHQRLTAALSNPSSVKAAPVQGQTLTARVLAAKASQPKKLFGGLD